MTTARQSTQRLLNYSISKQSTNNEPKCNGKWLFIRGSVIRRYGPLTVTITVNWKALETARRDGGWRQPMTVEMRLQRRGGLDHKFATTQLCSCRLRSGPCLEVSIVRQV